MIQVPIGHAVRFRREILDANNRPLWRSPLTHNLILNAGLEMLANTQSADCWNVLVLGTGSKPTKRDSGIVTASLAAGVVTAAAAFFEAADVGRTFKFDNTAKEYRITEYQSATAVAVDSSDTVAADQFMIWYSNEVTHGAEHSRIITYATDAGFNGYTTDDATGTWTNFRTFLSPTFAADTLITEIGWAPSTSAGSQLFGRALVPGGGDYVVAGQKYRVRVEHSMVWGPREVVAVGNICQQDGFDTSGAFALERVPKCSCVNSDGTTGNSSGQYRRNFEPTSHTMWLNLAYTGSQTATDALAYGGFGAVDTDLSTGLQYNASADAYVAGSHRRTWSYTFGVGQGNSTAIDSVLLTLGFSKGLRHKFATPQTKTNLYELKLSMGMQWGRTLSNTAA